ncbi:MAG: alanine--tRNA ligase [Acutalibacteraceae bacterium]|nr:alanine--tRNA ligase [Acutalibacteraceae bacterium]
MQWTSLNELREKYLSFFEGKGHLRLGSFSLVPNNDKSLLLINSGMAPMKKYFTGEITPPRNRVTTCQKCIRTPDLERVGHTARHGTYFEMLGNFSFGDYFKEEAISWAWEFLTETLEIPKELLWPSIYEEDDEAYAIWRDKIGVDESHIVRLGKADNFWEHGTGPCGPCSEIYFDRGVKYGCGSPDCKPGCECDRYMEIWNNVFSQFNNMGDGTYTELEHKNIDTGMGLERLACVMQGVDNMFEVDTIRNILNKVCQISGKTYGKDSGNDISIRAVTDHSRAATFMISDGIMPSNEGRGYVLRRLIRRAARHGKMLGINRPFLVEMCDAVIKENVNAYTELGEKETLIKKVLATEEAAFSKTIDQGLAIITELTKNGGVVSGEDAFRLYDTYGFPLDLTKDILSEKNMSVDEETFNKLMQEQRQKAREGRKASDAQSWKSDGISFDNLSETVFVGYTDEVCSGSVVGIALEGEQSGSINEGQKGVIVLDTTCFYAESGGQVGDTGIIENENGCFVVENTTKNGGVFMHFGTMEKGSFSVGDAVKGVIDTARRNAIKRNHTAAHLLQAALRKVLGTHVEQAGQLVNDKAVRFDFTHFSAMTEDEINEVETYVNAVILAGIEVDNREMPIEEAKKMGAMALFGEKYGDVVRVVAVSDKSVELCGGTHIDNSAKIGLFRIISESGIASGVRRIEAVTGTGVLDTLIHYKEIIDAAAAVQKCGNIEELATKTASLVAENKEKDKKIAALEAKLAGGKLDDIIKNAVTIGDTVVVSAVLEGTGSEELRSMAEKVKGDNPLAIAVFAGVNDGKLTFCAACGKEAVAKGVSAGNLVRSVAEIAGGKGGGRPDFAMAGGKDVALAGKAIDAVTELVKDMIGE